MTQRLKKTLLFFMSGPRTIFRALKITLKAQRLKWFFGVSFCILFLLHLYILPAHILGMDIGLSSFLNLNTEIVVFSFLLSLLESIVIAMLFFLIANKSHCKTTSAAGGALIGLVTPLLCCSPILPTLLGFVAVLFPSAMFGVGIKIQYLINIYPNRYGFRFLTIAHYSSSFRRARKQINQKF